MKSKITSSLLVLTGFLLGATALSALAWNGPGAGCTPPDCNVSAPVNVGSNAQTKLGPLTVNSNTTAPIADIGLILGGKIKIIDGNQAAGKVLTSDANGIGTWQSVGDTAAVNPDISYYYDSGSGYQLPPVGFNMTTTTSVLPGSNPSQTGFTPGTAFSLSGKTKVGMVGAGHGGSIPYVQLVTNKRVITIESKYVRYGGSENPVIIAEPSLKKVTIGYTGSAGHRSKIIYLGFDETPLTMKAAGNVFDNAGLGDTSYLIYNQ